MQLSGDSAIEFASGQITSLSGDLTLNGNDAFIVDSTSLGLEQRSDRARFDRPRGRHSISKTGPRCRRSAPSVGQTDSSLTSTTARRIQLTVRGTLTDYAFNALLRIGNATLSASDKVTAAALDYVGSIDLTRLSAANSGAPRRDQQRSDPTPEEFLRGDVRLAGDSAIEFASGQITSSGFQMKLTLFGTRRLHRG